MCRFIAYLGSEILLETVLLQPSNSLLAQSIKAKEAQITTNGDGFGMSWYSPELSNEPGLFTSILPAWNDRNLINLTKKIVSPCFFAHVRAANEGSVTAYNCHPFCYQQYSFMHNGVIGQFPLVKRHIRQLLDDDIYQSIQGDTDSEHAFALFLQHAKHRGTQLSASDLADILRTTIKDILELVAQFGNNEPSYLNLCVSNGKTMIASRFGNNPHHRARTLYYAQGEEFTIDNELCHLKENKHKQCVLIASEKLTKPQINWQSVDNQQLIIVDEQGQLSTQALSRK